MKFSLAAITAIVLASATPTTVHAWVATSPAASAQSPSIADAKHMFHRTNLVETKQDPFGGTGLYATGPITKGETMYRLPEQGIVFADAPEHTLLSECIDFLTGGADKCGITESLSIGASLASWRLLQQQPPQQNHQQQSNMLQDQIKQQVGISTASEFHAESLPWEKARWQLPIMWSEEVLDQALNYGIDQVVLMTSISQHYYQSEHYNAMQQQTQQQQQQQVEQHAQDIQHACQEAKKRVVNFQVAAARLAQELGPPLQETHGITATPEDVSLACHQAMALVFSRTFLHRGEITMLPIIDCANHEAVPNAKLQNDYETSGSMLVAQQDIAQGDEVTISYGLEESGSVLSFSGYGFIPHGMAEESAAGKALQLAALKGQEIAKEQLRMQEEQQQQKQQQLQQQATY